MAVFRTIGEAYDAKWGVRMRCQRGDHRGPVKIDPCHYESQLCLLTLVATRGRDFPLPRLASRIRCPNCGDLGVALAFDVPGAPIPVFQPIHYRRGER
jgi:hypothetical protein